MTYEEMMSLGKDCGLTTIAECYDNILIHYDMFFNIKHLAKEIVKLQKDIYKKNPQGFIETFSTAQDLIAEWNREEKFNRTLTIEYETFPEDDTSVLTVVDPETDTAIFMANNEKADELYKHLTQYE